MKRVKEQPTRATFSKHKYWDHVAANQTNQEDDSMERSHENPRANPDNLDEAMSMYQVKMAEREVQDRVKKLMALAKQILTQQQYNVFVLTMVKDPALTERECAKALSINPSRVHQHLVRIRAKLEDAYNSRTGETK